MLDFEVVVVVLLLGGVFLVHCYHLIYMLCF